MNTHVKQCDCCKNQISVTASQLFMYGVQWACPICKHVIDFSTKQIKKPDASQEAKAVWAAIGIVALFIGTVKLVDRLAS